MSTEREADAVWHFTYGANMCTDVLVERRGIRPRSSERAKLGGYRFSFSKRGIPYVEPGFANIVEDAGGVVHGVLYRVDRSDFETLARLEAEYRIIEVRVEGSRSGRVLARAFTSAERPRARPPSARYLAIVCAGAREHGIPREYVDWLSAHRSVSRPIVGRVAARLVRVFELLRDRGWLSDSMMRAIRRRTSRHRSAGLDQR